MSDVTLKDAMRRVAATVGVVSARFGDQDMAMTATSFCSLSLEPPALLVCVNRQAAMHEVLAVGSRFCMNVLEETQDKVSAACGGQRQRSERFEGGDWEACGQGAPYVRGAQANVFCEVVQRIDYGTHTIIIGQVADVRVSQGRSPLVYFDGGYVSVKGLAV